jgi:hypothetical protein
MLVGALAGGAEGASAAFIVEGTADGEGFTRDLAVEAQWELVGGGALLADDEVAILLVSTKVGRIRVGGFGLLLLLVGLGATPTTVATSAVDEVFVGALGIGD